MLKNYVLETASAPGTATGVTLAGPAAGRVSFVSQFGSGATCFYFATDDTQAEAGIATITAGPPDTLTRPSTVLWNSAGTTARLNFTGATRFYNAVPAGNMLFRDGSGNVSVGGKLANVAAGAFGGDAPRMDQVESLVQMVTGAPASVAMALPSAFSDFRLEWVDAGPTVSAQLVIQFSTDGGSTYHGSASDYQWLVEQLTSGASSNVTNMTDVLIVASPTVNFGELQVGSFRFTAGSPFTGLLENAGAAAGTLTRRHGVARPTFSGPLTNIKFFTSAGTFSSARVRLFGMFA